MISSQPPDPLPAGGGASGRLPGLDLVRAMAITFVVLEHSIDLSVGPLPWQHVLLSGRLGVDLFFVLSGFLIGGMIFRAGENLAQPQVLMGFLLGRWMRTLPLYYLILILRQVLRVAVYGIPPQPWPLLGTYALFFQNLAWPMPGYFVESWSLAVEEWFYLLLPLVVGLGSRLGLRKHGAFWLGVTGLLVVPFFLRVLVLDPAGAGSAGGHIVIHRLDAIAWGVLAAALAAKWPEAWRRMRWPALGAGLVLVVVCYTFATDGTSAFISPWAQSLHLTISSISLTLVLPWAATIAALRPAWLRYVAERIARWSYAMYLTNLLVAGILSDWLTRMRPGAGLNERLVFMAGYWLCTLVLSATLYRWIETPVMAWRKRVRLHQIFTAAARQ